MIASLKHIFAAVVVLTHSQIATLPTTPIELVPAPGDGKVIVPLLVTVSWNFQQPYTNINTIFTATEFGWGNHGYSGINASQQIYTTNLTGKIAESNTVFAPISSWNTPFNIWITNANLGNFTGGDPSNTMTIKVEYAIDDL